MKDIYNYINESSDDKKLKQAIEILGEYFDDYNKDKKEVEKIIFALLDKISYRGDNENVFNAIEDWINKRK